MKKVCIWCEKWGSGGIESFIINILESMDRSGLEIKLVTAACESDIFDKRLQRLGVEKVLLLDSQTDSAIKRNLKLPSIFRAYLNREKFDVIHLNIYHGVAMQYAKSAAKAGVSTRIIHSHNGALRPSRLRFVKEMAHKLASNTMSKFGTHFCACSDVAAQWMFPKCICGQTLMIANGVDIDRFTFNETVRKETRASLCLGDAFTLCCVGRICSQKNQTFLLEVFAEILKTEPTARLLLAGADDSGGEIVRLADSLGISGSVHFLGVTDNIPQLLWASDVFVLPSLFEGNPVSGVEAQAGGISCVFSDAITREADLTGLVTYLSLKDTPGHWAQEILSRKGARRQDTSHLLRQKGYDIKDSAAILGRLYRG